MRIVFDIRPLQTHSKFRGIGTYAKNLLINLLEIDKENTYILWGYKDREYPDYINDYNNDIEKFLISGGGEFQRFRQQIPETLKLNYGLLKYRPSIVHFHLQLNPFILYPSVSTCHSANTFIFKEAYLNDFGSWLKWNLHRLCIKQSRAVLTVSNFAKDSISRYFHIDKYNIVVSYNGISDIFLKFNMRKKDSVLQKYNLQKDGYILYVGGTGFTKNLKDLIHIYYDTIIPEFPSLKLVLIGKRSLYDRIAHLWSGMEPKPILTGFIPNEELPPIYSGAKALVLTSRYESFSFPIIESLSVGTPVVAYDHSVISEYNTPGLIKCGDMNVSELGNAVLKLLKDKSFKEREMKKSIKFSKRFSWEDCARRTLETYLWVCGKKRRPEEIS